jgi:hypothetical protein
MSEELRRFIRLGDLATVRIVCKKCGAVAESAMEELAKRDEPNKPNPKLQSCWICPQSFGSEVAELLHDLAHAVAGLKAASAKLAVEFSLPVDEATIRVTSSPPSSPGAGGQASPTAGKQKASKP